MYDTAVFVYCSCEVPYLTILVASITMKAAMRHITNKTVKHSSLLSKTIEVIFSTFLKKKKSQKLTERAYTFQQTLTNVFYYLSHYIYKLAKMKIYQFSSTQFSPSRFALFCAHCNGLILKTREVITMENCYYRTGSLVMYFGSSRLTYSL